MSENTLPEFNDRPSVPAYIITCDICKTEFLDNRHYIPFCQPCHLKYGDHLLKSLADPFDYAFGLRSGAIIRIIGNSPTLKGDWLIFPQLDPKICVNMPYPCERGLQVRLSDIVWVADAPLGS